MFTGIIEEVGRITDRRPQKSVLELTLDAERIGRELAVGASVAVSGVCLTVTRVRETRFAVELSNETVERTHLGRWEPGRGVNLELPLRLSDRLGGHLVQGHVDSVGTILSVEERAGDRRVRVGHGADAGALVVEKGSIAVDGVSLTIASCGPGWFEVMLIPHTLSVTTLGSLQAGDPVNLEYDILAKYVVRLAEIYRTRGDRS